MLGLVEYSSSSDEEGDDNNDATDDGEVLSVLDTSTGPVAVVTAAVAPPSLREGSQLAHAPVRAVEAVQTPGGCGLSMARRPLHSAGADDALIL